MRCRELVARRIGRVDAQIVAQQREASRLRSRAQSIGRVGLGGATLRGRECGRRARRGGERGGKRAHLERVGGDAAAEATFSSSDDATGNFRRAVVVRVASSLPQGPSRMFVLLVAALLQATSPDQPQAPAPPPPRARARFHDRIVTGKEAAEAHRGHPRAPRHRIPRRRGALASCSSPARRARGRTRRSARTTQRRISASPRASASRSSAAIDWRSAARKPRASAGGAASAPTSTSPVRGRSIPIAGKSGDAEIHGGISPVPYFPGSETLWIGASMTQKDVDEKEAIVHPLAEGAEAYYTFESGDSATFRLPDGKTIRLRELKVRPRVPKWNLAVGSLWFDMSGGQLVRAAYRMSVPMDIKAVAEEDDSTSFEDVPRVMKPMLFPMKAEISAIGVEYGLYQGRFWLPRVQVRAGRRRRWASCAFPSSWSRSSATSSVNAGEPLAPIPFDDRLDARPGRCRKSASADRRRRGASATPRARRGARRACACDSAGNRTTRAQPRRCGESRVHQHPVRQREARALARSARRRSTTRATRPCLQPRSTRWCRRRSRWARRRDSPRAGDARLRAAALQPHRGAELAAACSISSSAQGTRCTPSARIGVADREPNIEFTGVT